MKAPTNENFKIPKGTGLLLAIALTSVMALTVFALSNNFVVTVAASTPVGVTLGIELEQRFRGGKRNLSSRTAKVLLGLLLLGIILFFAIISFLKFT